MFCLWTMLFQIFACVVWVLVGTGLLTSHVGNHVWIIYVWYRVRVRDVFELGILHVRFDVLHPFFVTVATACLFFVIKDVMKFRWGFMFHTTLAKEMHENFELFINVDWRTIERFAHLWLSPLTSKIYDLSWLIGKNCHSLPHSPDSSPL